MTIVDGSWSTPTLQINGVQCWMSPMLDETEVSRFVKVIGARLLAPPVATTRSASFGRKSGHPAGRHARNRCDARKGKAPGTGFPGCGRSCIGVERPSRARTFVASNHPGVVGLSGSSRSRPVVSGSRLLSISGRPILESADSREHSSVVDWSSRDRAARRLIHSDASAAESPQGHAPSVRRTPNVAH